ncbi:hypothetical protein D3C75_826440 [compost metagenome]
MKINDLCLQESGSCQLFHNIGSGKGHQFLILGGETPVYTGKAGKLDMDHRKAVLIHFPTEKAHPLR